MNENAFKRIKDVLPTASGQHAIEGVSMETVLEHSRVTPQTPLPPMQHLFEMYGTPCFYRGELVAVCGKAKSGKTLFLSILMAACLTDRVLALERCHAADGEGGEGQALKLLWIDTEQSAQSTQDILVNRILPMAGVPEDINDSFYAFNLRGYGYEARKKVMEYAIGKLKPDLVIIDGIKDLLTDINDAVHATLVMEQLMALAQEHNCCIVNVLHMNKSDADKNMRGSIGTELTNKAFEVFQCEYIAETDRFKVKQAMSRKQRIGRKMYYMLDDNAIPQECDASEGQPRDGQGRFISSKPQQTVTPEVKWETLNQRYLVPGPNDSFSWNIGLLFEDAFEGKRARPFAQVMAAALRLSRIEDVKIYYGLYRDAQEQEIIHQKTHPESGEAWVELNENALPYSE